MKKLTNYFIGVVSFFTIFAGFFSYTYAQTTVVCPEGKYCALTTIPGATEAGKVANPTDVIKRIYSISIGIAAILAVIMIIWGGIQYATTEAMSGKSDAKDHIQSAFLGLLILVGSYLILKTINSQLVNINLDLGMSKLEELKGGLTAGGDVYSTMLGDVMKNVSDKTKALEAARTNVEAAQKSQSELQSQVDKINSDLKGMNGATPEARALVAQGLLLQQQIEAAKIAVQAAQAAQSLKSIDQRSSSISELAISNALSRGDVATAQNLISTSRQLMQQDLDALKNNPSATANDIKLASSKMNVTNVFTNKILEAVNGLGTVQVVGSTGTQYLDSGVVSQRTAFQEGISSVSSTGATQDPTNSTAYAKSAELALQAYDKALAQKLGCTGGITVAAGITCAK